MQRSALRLRLRRFKILTKTVLKACKGQKISNKNYLMDHPISKQLIFLISGPPNVTLTPHFMCMKYISFFFGCSIPPLQNGRQLRWSLYLRHNQANVLVHFLKEIFNLTSGSLSTSDLIKGPKDPITRTFLKFKRCTELICHLFSKFIHAKAILSLYKLRNWLIFFL